MWVSMKYGLGAAVSRLFTSSPGHVCYGIIMGVILYKVFKIRKFNIKSVLLLFLSLLIPSILHAIYNTFLYQGIGSLYIYSSIFLLVLVIICSIIAFKVYKTKK